MGTEKLGKTINDMSESMVSFSDSMKSLYKREAVGPISEAVKQSRMLQHEVGYFAIIYFENLFPDCVELVESIREFFEYYEELDYEKWCENLEDILEETTGYKQLCDCIIETHSSIFEFLEEKDEQADYVVKHLTIQQKKFEEEKEKLEEDAKFKSNLAFGLIFLPVIGWILRPALLEDAKNLTAEAAASGAQSQIQKDTASEIQEKFKPSLCLFMQGLHKIKDFFQEMEVELGKFQGKAIKGKESEKESKKKFHYTMMKAKAKKIDAACKKFHSFIPIVESNLKAIRPKEQMKIMWIDG